jgi:hypothetical protein
MGRCIYYEVGVLVSSRGSKYQEYISRIRIQNNSQTIMEQLIKMQLYSEMHNRLVCLNCPKETLKGDFTAGQGDCSD